MFIKIFKKNQLIFLTLGLMLIVAGYLNYTYNPEARYKSELTGNIEETLGDTIYVNAIPSDDTIIKTDIDESNKNEIQQVEEDDDEYFVNTKLQRDKMYDEQLDLYKEIINNSQASNQQKEEANRKIEEINNLKNSIMIAENLILLKDIENVMILTTGKNVNVVIQNEQQLEKDKVAQIYDIVTKELNVDINDIQIILKKI